MAESPELAPIELRKEWTRLRSLLYEGHNLALCTDERDGRRWLTDRYVLLDVTDSIAVTDLPDGCYKLSGPTAKAPGLQPETHEFEGEEIPNVNYLAGGIVDYLTNVEAGAKWMAATPSEWSVAEHPGKAMVFAVEDPDHGPAHPALIGESTWTTLRRHFDSPCIEFDPYSGRNLFRVMVPVLRIVAYVAGIQIPTGQEAVAQAVAELTRSQLATILEV